MSFWQEHDLEGRIRLILSEVVYYDPQHHFGRPFLTPYQLAIELTRRFPEVAEQFGHPIGGHGSGVSLSLASDIAGQLSRKIRSREITDIEGGFLSNRYLLQLIFQHHGQRILSSLTGTQHDLSSFMLIQR